MRVSKHINEIEEKKKSKYSLLGCDGDGSRNAYSYDSTSLPKKNGIFEFIDSGRVLMHADRRRRYPVGSGFDTGALTRPHCRSSAVTADHAGVRSESRFLFYGQ